MKLVDLKKLGYIFNITNPDMVYVSYEYQFQTYDGWDSDQAEYGEYPDLETAIATISSDIAYDTARERLDMFSQVANDNYYQTGDFKTYLHLLQIFTNEIVSLKRL